MSWFFSFGLHEMRLEQVGRLRSDLSLLWDKSLEEAKISGRAVKPMGVNVLGWTHGLFGVAESARLVYLSIKSIHIPAVANTLLLALEHNHTDRSIADTREAPYRFNLVVCNADSTPTVQSQTLCFW
jgi:hypothetical protein